MTAQQLELSGVPEKPEQPMVVRDEATAMLEMIERVALNPDADVEKMRALLDMRRELMADAAKVAFESAFAEFQERCPRVERKKTGAHEVKYAPLEDIMEQILPHLNDTRLSVRCRQAKMEDGVITVTTRVSHTGGHYEDSDFSTAVDPAMKANDSQKIASANTYARRYGLMNALNVICVGDDDDGVKATGLYQRRLINALCQLHADSLEAIRQCIDEHLSGQGDLVRAFEAWNELPDDDKAALWVAPTKCREMGIEPVFTTREIAAFKSPAWGEARRSVMGEDAK